MTTQHKLRTEQVNPSVVSDTVRERLRRELALWDERPIARRETLSLWRKC